MKINSDKKTEFERFDDVMGKLLSVPHEKIQKELEKEKKKKRRKATSSASPEAGDKD